jgi:hypothetical protein
MTDRGQPGSEVGCGGKAIVPLRPSYDVPRLQIPAFASFHRLKPLNVLQAHFVQSATSFASGQVPRQRTWVRRGKLP